MEEGSLDPYALLVQPSKAKLSQCPTIESTAAREASYSSSLHLHNIGISEIPKQQNLALNPEANFALRQNDSLLRSPSRDRFIPCRKSSNIHNKMQFSEPCPRQ